ncbi:MAG: hypothetical protein V4531_07290 [Actinomycetota bacterium]
MNEKDSFTACVKPSAVGTTAEDMAVTTGMAVMIRTTTTRTIGAGTRRLGRPDIGHRPMVGTLRRTTGIGTNIITATMSMATTEKFAVCL